MQYGATSREDFFATRRKADASGHLQDAEAALQSAVSAHTEEKVRLVSRQHGDLRAEERHTYDKWAAERGREEEARTASAVSEATRELMETKTELMRDKVRLLHELDGMCEEAQQSKWITLELAHAEDQLRDTLDDPHHPVYRDLEDGGSSTPTEGPNPGDANTDANMANRVLAPGDEPTGESEEGKPVMYSTGEAIYGNVSHAVYIGSTAAICGASGVNIVFADKEYAPEKSGHYACADCLKVIAAPTEEPEPSPSQENNHE